MRRCTFILMPKERGLKTEFIKKKMRRGALQIVSTDRRTDRRTDGQTDGRTDGQNPILIGSLLRDLNSLKMMIKIEIYLKVKK